MPSHLVQAASLAAFLSETPWLNTPTYWLVFVVIVILFAASIIGQTLKRQPENTLNPALLRTFNLRVRAWWMMFAILAAGFLIDRKSVV